MEDMKGGGKAQGWHAT